MFVRSLLTASALAAVLTTPVVAADLGSYGPSYACAPSQEFVAAPALQQDFKTWNRRADRPRVVFVEPFDPRTPPHVPTPLPNNGPAYMPPQTAYLASSLCDFAYGEPRRSWYDGKLFYKPGGIRSAPDTFMIIERD